MHNMNISSQEVCQEFYQCCIHTLLSTCQIYPDYLFESKNYLGILVKQSRHPQINEYIQRVFDNTKPMFVMRLVDRLIFAVEDNNGKSLYHITIKCQEYHDQLTIEEYKIIEEEFRSAILRLTTLESQFTKHPDDCRWKIMVVTKPAIEESENDLLSEVLTTGEWMIDNNQRSEQIALTQRINQSNNTPSPSDEATVLKTPKLKALKSYRDEKINLSVSFFPYVAAISQNVVF